MSKTSLLVTGASGHFGARAIELLLARGATSIIATTRKPEALARFRERGVEVRFADFDEETSLPGAFAGAQRALLISTDEVMTPGKRIRQQRAAVRALEAAGVAHVVYTSLPNADRSSASVAPDHAATEAALRETKLDYTILRNNIYADLFVLSLPSAIAAGQIVDAREAGKAAYVTREDCVRTAAVVLAGPALTGRQTFDVTGPGAIGGDELAAIVSEVVGRPIARSSVPAEALVAGMVQHGLPRPLAELYASFDVSVARGELAQVTNTVEKLTGQAPTSLRDFLRTQRAALGG
jgi:NAD(P)H dehydrogenase (quinone)